MPFQPSTVSPVERVRDQVVIDGRFRLSQRLGGDACGDIWLVEDLNSETRRVIHFLDPYFGWDEAERERVRESWTRCQELNHEHIVRIDGFMADREDAAVLTEWVDGWNLRALMAVEPEPFFDVEQIRFWMEACCRGLHYAHHYAQVVHGDLRPSHLWIASDGNLKIGGFGKSALRLPARDEETPRAGARSIADRRLGYRSPQLREGRLPRTSDDIYSLGATLFELLAGRPPLAGEPSRSVNSVRRLAVEDAVVVSPEWEAVIEACLSQDEHGRPASVREVAGALGFELSQGVRRVPEFTPGFQELMKSSNRGRTDRSVSGETGGKPKAKRSRQPMVERRVRISRDYLEWSRHLMGTGVLLWSGVMLVGLLALLSRCDFGRQAQVVADRPVEDEASVPGQSGGSLSTSSRDVVERRPWLSEAERLASGGEWEEADKILQDHAASSSSDIDYFLLQARVDFHLSRLDSALAAVRALLKAEPRHAIAAKLKAALHRERQEHAQTVRAATWALQLAGNANDSELLRWRGESFRHLGELEEAARDFTASLRGRVEPDLLYLRGLAQRENGMAEAALRSFSESIELAPAHAEAREARALLSLAESKVEPTTVEDLTFLIEREEDDERRIGHAMNRLLAWSALGEAEGIIADATTLLESRPDWSAAYLYRAEARGKLGDLKGALQDLELYFEGGGQGSVNLYADLAEHQFKLGRFAEAAEAYTKLLSIDPGFGVAYNARAYAWFLLAEEVSSRAEKIRLRKQAMADCLRVVKDFPEAINRDTFVVKGWLHFKMGDYDEAENTGRLGSSYFPDSEEHFRELLEETKQARRARAIRAAREEPQERPSLLDRIFGRSKRKSSPDG